jgi:hypothetical protein
MRRMPNDDEMTNGSDIRPRRYNQIIFYDLLWTKMEILIYFSKINDNYKKCRKD